MKQDWDEFWGELEGEENLFRKFLSFYRIQIIARAVNYYINKYFEPEGVFVECGAGKSETTMKTRKLNRKFVALDFSGSVLKMAITNRKIDCCVNADIFSLPFKDNSVDGIWNIGVMEHFTANHIDKILKEFRRVIKNDGCILLFWPMVYAPYEIFISIIEFMVNRFSKEHFQIYPDEIFRLRSRMQGREILAKNNFKSPKAYFNFRDAFSFCVVIGTK